ncbi:hypothetical protein CC117_26195 [Parafrankia colletiae]|uniref:Uncharacterized protein n=1 Tax=Parafrankia colletiae TaxID=573497 RepID=A0A1S1QBY5_9ACTN|nr:hypothetical protein CC117_26195 [Parafrankia colletiae]
MTFVPSERTAKCVSPRSMPTSDSTGGNTSSVVSTTNDAKYRPAASRTTVTDDGAAGRSRDQRTATSPIFGRRSFRPAVTTNRAFFVNRIACRLSFRDRNRSGKTFRPFRFPDSEEKKFRYAVFRSARACCSTTADTSPSQARSPVRFASVMTRRDISPSETYRSPSTRASCLSLSASLNTTRPQPNARANAAT